MKRMVEHFSCLRGMITINRICLQRVDTVLIKYIAEFKEGDIV